MAPEALIDALRRRESGALDELRVHYGPLIRYIIAPILPDDRDREEAFSDVLLRVWDGVGSFDPARGSWKSWLAAIARNAAVDRARRSPKGEEALMETVADPAGSPEEELLRREQTEALRRALQTLSQEELLLFYRKYYYRQSTARMAAEYGLTERAMEGRLYRIKQKLRRRLGGDAP